MDSVLTADSVGESNLQSDSILSTKFAYKLNKAFPKSVLPKSGLDQSISKKSCPNLLGFFFQN